MKFVQQYTAKT